MKTKIPATVDEYIEKFPDEIGSILQTIREIILSAVPKATEAIKYAIPTYMLEGNFVHFAATRKHIGLYPAPRSSVQLIKQIKPYLAHKSTLQFSIDKPLPKLLIRKIVKTLAEENLRKAEIRKVKK
jgi:uncharacterized protein YdhG (YjbR/CyaY superfamily)